MGDTVKAVRSVLRALKTPDKVTSRPANRSAAEAVVRAWRNPGRHPRYHRLMKARLKRDWPMLATAVERLAREEMEREDGRAG